MLSSSESQIVSKLVQELYAATVKKVYDSKTGTSHTVYSAPNGGVLVQKDGKVFGCITYREEVSKEISDIILNILEDNYSLKKSK